MRWASAARADWLALGFAGVAAAAVGVFGFSVLSIGIPLAVLLVMLADGIARPGSSLLYPTIRHGSRNGCHVALSFDDGPDPQVTPAVLDALAQHGARATFFTIGRALHANPALARRIADEHHELGNHSWGHSRWQNFWGTRSHRREIELGAQAITSLGGSVTQPLYRPPIGLKSPPLARAARSLRLTIVAWSLHSRDTRSDDPHRIARRVLGKIRPGDIVLMHDGHDRPGRHRPACARALPLILEGLAQKRLQCVTVSELIEAQRNDTTARWPHKLWQGLKAHAGLKMLAGWLIAGGFFAGYFLLLKFPLFPVTLVPVLAADHWIAFWPGALWLYASLWLYVALAPGLITDRRELLDYYVAMVALSVAGMAVFLLWPTASPHPGIDWVNHSELGFVIAADDKGNALPSLHAAFAVFSAIWMDRLLRRATAPHWLRIVSAAWGCGILYSTLATRQHVLLDVMAGTALGWLAAVLHARWLNARRVAPRASLDPEASA
jgi:peptidoglycan/xylan/chitin deacetylase (PgdA/CDA1 family)/membrane-associated phospholipid phosphatase